MTSCEQLHVSGGHRVCQAGLHLPLTISTQGGLCPAVPGLPPSMRECHATPKITWSSSPAPGTERSIEIKQDLSLQHLSKWVVVEHLMCLCGCLVEWLRMSFDQSSDCHLTSTVQPLNFESPPPQQFAVGLCDPQIHGASLPDRHDPRCTGVVVCPARLSSRWLPAKVAIC